MKNNNKKVLIFFIDNKKFETFEQYMTGADLKKLAGIPLHIKLFLKVQEGYKPDLIENDEPLDLARTDVEHLYVEDKLKFTINTESFISYEQYISSEQIRTLGRISENDNLFLKVPPPYEDELIVDDRMVDLALPGKEDFISKPPNVNILVNTRTKAWSKRNISFEEVVILAFGSYDPNPQKIYTVNYSGGFEPKPEGSMVKGMVVYVKDKMNFDVSATNQS